MTPERRRAWFASMVAAMVMALTGYDASTFNSIQGFRTFANHFKSADETEIASTVLGAVNTAYHVGSIVSGMLIAPTLSKKLGRRIPIQIGTSLVLVSTFIQSFAPNMAAFIAGRAVMGLGQGISMSNGATYIAEIAPTHIRGVMLSCWQLWFTIGAFVVYWAAYGAQKSSLHLGLWQWRIPLLVQLPVPIFIIVGMLFCPETPRWLVDRDRLEDARRSLRLVRHEEEVDAELESIITALAYEKASDKHHAKWWSAYWTLIRESSLLRRVLIVIFLNGGQQISGSSSLNAYATLIYKKVFHNDDTIFLINALSATCSILFTLSCMALIETAGRRFILFTGAVGMGLSLLVVAVLGMKTPVYTDGSRPYGVGVGIAAMFFLFIFFYKPSWGATVWIYTSEIFSTDVRAHGVAIGAQTQSIVSTILNQFFPTFLKNCGFYTFFFFFGINFLLALGVWFFLPETKGVPLEEIDALFGSVSHRESGETLVGHKIQAAVSDPEKVDAASPKTTDGLQIR